MAKTPLRLARTLRFICDYVLGAALVAAPCYLIWILWLLISPTSIGLSPGLATGGVWVWIGALGPAGLSLPVTVDPGDTGVIPKAGLFNTMGELKFETRDRRLLVLSFLDRIVFSLLFMGLAYVVRQFLVDVIDGYPFTFDNARRLKWIGWFSLGIGVVKPVVRNFATIWTFSIVKIHSPTLSPPIDLDFGWILASLFILILSAAFRHGVELERESSLTV